MSALSPKAREQPSVFLAAWLFLNYTRQSPLALPLDFCARSGGRRGSLRRLPPPICGAKQVGMIGHSPLMPRGSPLANATCHRHVAPKARCADACGLWSSFRASSSIRTKKEGHPVGCPSFLERATRLELATSTLARSRSTR